MADDVIIISHAMCVLTAKFQLFAKKGLNTHNFAMDSNHFVFFNCSMLFSCHFEVL